jgi:DNA-binding transcriptional regulator LsrR (DeoR family)
MSASASAVHVSHLFFKRRLTKQEIAARLGISRFKVARLIDEALEEGLVTIEVAEPFPLVEESGRELELAFGLELALVVRAAPELDPVEATARLAASWLPELIRPGDVLGVAWGSTIQRVARALAAGPAVPVVQICGHVAGLESGEGPLELAWQFAERLGGAYHPLPVPALVASAAARDEILANGAVAPTVAMFERVTVALVGIGSLEGEGRSSLLASGTLERREIPAGAVGDLLVHFFDEKGQLIETPLEERAVQLPVEGLRRARVIAVAGGTGKASAIRAALCTGLVDVLVTDEANAEAALR